MEKELNILMKRYDCNLNDLAVIIGCSLRTLYRLKKDQFGNKFLREKIKDMIKDQEK